MCTPPRDTSTRSLRRVKSLQRDNKPTSVCGVRCASRANSFNEMRDCFASPLMGWLSGCSRDRTGKEARNGSMADLVDHRGCAGGGGDLHPHCRSRNAECGRVGHGGIRGGRASTTSPVPGVHRRRRSRMWCSCVPLHCDTSSVPQRCGSVSMRWSAGLPMPSRR